MRPIRAWGKKSVSLFAVVALAAPGLALAEGDPPPADFRIETAPRDSQGRVVLREGVQVEGEVREGQQVVVPQSAGGAIIFEMRGGRYVEIGPAGPDTAAPPTTMRPPGGTTSPGGDRPQPGRERASRDTSPDSGRGSDPASAGTGSGAPGTGAGAPDSGARADGAKPGGAPARPPASPDDKQRLFDDFASRVAARQEAERAGEARRHAQPGAEPSLAGSPWLGPVPFPAGGAAVAIPKEADGAASGEMLVLAPVRRVAADADDSGPSAPKRPRFGPADGLVSSSTLAAAARLSALADEEAQGGDAPAGAVASADLTPRLVGFQSIAPAAEPGAGAVFPASGAAAGGQKPASGAPGEGNGAAEAAREPVLTASLGVQFESMLSGKTLASPKRPADKGARGAAARPATTRVVLNAPRGARPAVRPTLARPRALAATLAGFFGGLVSRAPAGLPGEEGPALPLSLPSADIAALILPAALLAALLLRRRRRRRS